MTQRSAPRPAVPARSPTRSGRAFTLIELLVVISIIARLVALLPALGRARRMALRAQEMSHMRQMVTGHLTYANDHDGRLFPGVRGKEKLPPHVVAFNIPLADGGSYSRHDVIEAYGFMPATGHPPLETPVVDRPPNTNSDGLLYCYFYLPGYLMRNFPQTGEVAAGSIRLSRARSDDAMIQDSTLRNTGTPAYRFNHGPAERFDKSASGLPSYAYRKAASIDPMAGFHAARYDGSAHWLEPDRLVWTAYHSGGWELGTLDNSAP